MRNSADARSPRWWEGAYSEPQSRQQRDYTPVEHQQYHTPVENQQHHTHNSVEHPSYQTEPSLREQELELQIQELKTKLGRKQDNTQVFLNLLDVSDNLARALEAVPAEETNVALKSLCEGVELTSKGLHDIFASSGIVKYGQVGDQFDHHIHHALCEFPDPDKEPDTVGHVIKAGYLLNGSVLRYAEVAVIKSQPSPSKECELDY
jgi:molecular chaperone GrpE (heat shock protein)